jgi:hypothetical protein
MLVLRSAPGAAGQKEVRAGDMRRRREKPGGVGTGGTWAVPCCWLDSGGDAVGSAHGADGRVQDENERRRARRLGKTRRSTYGCTVLTSVPRHAPGRVRLLGFCQVEARGGLVNEVAHNRRRTAWDVDVS